MAKFLGIYNIPGILTFSSLILALIACFFSFNQHLNYAVICLIYAGIFDLFDGYVARRLNLSQKEKSFGLQIDSIADVVSFGVTPVIIALHSGFNTFGDHLLHILYLSCAAMRLAYFNLEHINNNTIVKKYTGLPVTYAALIFSLVYLVKVIDKTTLYYRAVIRLSFFIVSILFILKIAIPKPKGIFYFIFPSGAIVLTAVWLIVG